MIKPKTRKRIDLLELGFGSSSRLKSQASHPLSRKQGWRFVGVDRKSRAKSNLPNLEFRTGTTRGDAINVLNELYQKGQRVRIVKAEFLFSDPPKNKGSPENIKSTILNLCNLVMQPNGKLIITDFKDNYQSLRVYLRAAGFEVVSCTKILENDKKQSRWAKEGHKRAKKEEDEGWRPVRIIARKAKEAVFCSGQHQVV